MTQHSHFFAHLARMKLIFRWPLMRNVISENIQEHSLQVAMIAHALALIKNKKFGGQLNPDAIASKAMFHDVTEVLTGDLPTPVKYYNPAISHEYKKIEKAAETQLLSMLPDEFYEDYAQLIDEHKHSQEEQHIIKSADLLCAYLKTIEEQSAGNTEFTIAQKRLMEMLDNRMTDELRYFIDTFVPSFSLSIDEINDVNL